MLLLLLLLKGLTWIHTVQSVLDGSGCPESAKGVFGAVLDSIEIFGVGVLSMRTVIISHGIRDFDGEIGDPKGRI